jgi:hypothetical protein
VTAPRSPARRGWGAAAAALVLGVLVPAEAAKPESGPEDTLRAVERSLAEGDLPAARSRIESAASARPEDCTVRAWLAWLEIESGRPEAAQALLAAGACPVESEDRGRWALLRALGAERRADATGLTSALLDVDERQPLWPEDRALARTLSLRHRDGYSLPLEAQAELGLGATSNAFALSPTDAARREAPGSAVARPALRLRLRAPEAGWTPSLELGARGYGLAADEARELSQAEISAAAGLRLGRGATAPTVRYRHEDLFLELVDGSRYWTADRGEVEVSRTRVLTLFAGAGRRVFFTDGWRTRTEWDLAALQALRFLGRPVVLGGAFRLYRAERAVHDQVGGTLTTATDIPVRAALRARLALSGAFDDFPSSGGVDGLVAFGTTDRRLDVTVRLSAGLWRALGAHAALGLTYEYARRWSTADSPDVRYYPYVDHRLLVTLRGGAAGNPWRARGREAPDRVALPYRDLEEWSVLRDDPVRQMLRREEDLGADCGCVVP